MEPELAYIIAGEAGACSFTAMIAVAYIYQRNNRFFGYSQPGYWESLIARNWYKFTDTSGGAEFLFSADDLQDHRVKRIIRGREPTKQWDCRMGLKLYAY